MCAMVSVFIIEDPTEIIENFAMMTEQIESLKQSAVLALQNASSKRELFELKAKFFGKNGLFQPIMREMGRLSAEDKPKLGAAINRAKTEIEQLMTSLESEFERREISARIEAETRDLSEPLEPIEVGSLNPISIVFNDINSLLGRLGYSVRTGPLIETDRNNFEGLNMPKNHSARDMQDTFYIDENHVLRTHTSPVQIRTFESERPPLRITAPGNVFRCDSDVSHLPSFHQIEGICVDRKVSMADLKGTVAFLVREFFGQDLKTRFRPSFFPFTEPSAEFDCQCPLCAGKGCRMCGDSGWVEIGGSGLIHPNVLSFCGIDPNQWQGFAFGFGIERMAIIRYGIDDIRLFAENDVRFLEQFAQ